MIVTVTLNPAVDITLTTSTLERGETHRVPPGASRSGGKGINVARVLTEQSIDALAIAPVGVGDLDGFTHDLGNVPHRLVPVVAPTRRSIAIVETETNVTTIFNESGTPQPANVWQSVTDTVTSVLDTARCIVVSGSVPPETRDNLVGEVTALGISHGIPTVADTTGEQLLGAARAGASVLKPNRRELADTVGTDDPVVGARALQQLGAGLILVSLGEEGMLAVPRDTALPVLRARLPRVLRGNPTGAGDAGVAGAATLIASGLNLDSADDIRLILSRATAWSAAAVLAPLAGSIHHSHGELESELQIDTV